jgi:hypothetical protein
VSAQRTFAEIHWFDASIYSLDHLSFELGAEASTEFRKELVKPGRRKETAMPRLLFAAAAKPFLFVLSTCRPLPFDETIQSFV